jgi:hypothetical protein
VFHESKAGTTIRPQGKAFGVGWFLDFMVHAENLRKASAAKNKRGGASTIQPPIISCGNATCQMDFFPKHG